ncbi:ABC transporter ATP-binding protein [Halorussus limi]|uniref:ABC transporter ATP-binding protein n=1 Tax=Halorussus limi TaxID=2938695 RepID=A0A8U0HU14_9EURY|nr:ABC transporter ATP-binding protein [Halorussus limi]UPV74339.1 ABC transporter ATP-binding protein [Halorussus limi]
MTIQERRERPGQSAEEQSAEEHSSEEQSSGSADDSQLAESPAIAVEGLRKRFGSGSEAVTAVDGVSFTVERGSVVGLLGPNGAGKTTTIKSILGMVLPDAGSVRIHGTDVYANPRRAYAHVDAMLEGARNDYWRLTVRENLRYFATIGGVDPDSIADRHDRLLDKLDLADVADQPVRNLSRGMKQKVSLASVLAGEADVIFLDEPTLGLDVESSLTLRRELRRIVAERNLTVIVSSHDMDVIEDICDRVVIMNEGRVIADDTVENLLRGFDARGYRVTSPDFDESLVADLRDRFEVVGVERLGDRTRVEVATDSDGFYALTAFLRSRDVTLDAVDTVDWDLEDVFVELTGGKDR